MNRSAISGKPLDLLICLLASETPIVEKEYIVKHAWPETSVVESVVKVTIGTLRKILGDEKQTLIITVFGVGYRIGVPIRCHEVEEIVIPQFRLQEKVPVPDKPTWTLEYALDRDAPHWVWAAKQKSNSLMHVFKFAEDGVRYSALQREITLCRLFAKAAPKSTLFCKGFRLAAGRKPPYYLEAEFGGINLLEWAAKLRDPEFGGLPRQLCLQIVAEICDAVDIAHDVGVFHNDLKPSNILLSQGGTDGAWHVKVSDFGIATLLEPQRLADYDITNHGFGNDPTATAIGSAMYHAPEVKPGQPSNAIRRYLRYRRHPLSTTQRRFCKNADSGLAERHRRSASSEGHRRGRQSKSSFAPKECSRAGDTSADIRGKKLPKKRLA